MKALPLLVLALLSVCAGGQDLPQKDAEKMDFEPELFFEGDLSSGKVNAAPQISAEAPDIARAETALARAQRKAARWQQLAARGVLSRLEAETAALQVLQAASKLAALRAQNARQQLEAAPSQQAPDDPAQVQITAAEAAASAAREALQHAKADAAQLHFQRQRQLYASGLISRKQLQRAEAAAAQDTTTRSR